jgi:hypothetical protein
MNLNEIKEAIDSGKKVFWKQDNYQVIKGKYEYLIECKSNKHCIGLTWRDGITMNGEEQDFFIGE